MLYILKGLYLEYKVRAYDAKIRACTKARTKLKKEQSKSSKKYEAYVLKLKDHKK